MKKYVCDVCGWIYDPAEGLPDEGIAPGTSFEDLPDDFICPECGATFEEEEGEEMDEEYYEEEEEEDLTDDYEVETARDHEMPQEEFEEEESEPESKTEEERPQRATRRRVR